MSYLLLQGPALVRATSSSLPLHTNQVFEISFYYQRVRLILWERSAKFTECVQHRFQALSVRDWQTQDTVRQHIPCDIDLVVI